MNPELLELGDSFSRRWPFQSHGGPGSLLTSAIIFYLAIGAAIFEVLEEPHWKEAKKNYYTQKLHLLKEFPCLSQEGLDKILQVSRRSPESSTCI